MTIFIDVQVFFNIFDYIYSFYRESSVRVSEKQEESFIHQATEGKESESVISGIKKKYTAGGKENGSVKITDRHSAGILNGKGWPEA